ncbi:MAG: flagellar biosynthesis protein FliQ [Bdellovibrionota bacterium]
MTEEFILGLGNEAIKIAALLSAPVLIVALVIGIGVSLLQAVTQINEATLTFVPKLAAISVVLIVSGPWMIDTITHYTTELFTRFPEFVR